MNHNELVENLLEQPYWVIDFLPMQVPQDARGLFFAVEQYYLTGIRHERLINQLADVVLQCGSNESPLEHGSVPARIAQLFLLDILFTRVTLTEPDGCRANRQRIAAALADKHL